MSDLREQQDKINQKHEDAGDTLASGLKSYEQALREEFDAALNGTSDEIAKRARERLALLLPEAGNQLLSILRAGTKEDAVRLQAIKLIFEHTLGKPSSQNTKEDDTEKLIQSLMKPESKSKS